MHQFTRLFGVTRVPAEGADLLVQEAGSKHIVILRDGAAVAMDIYDVVGKPLSMAQLKTQLQAR